MRPSSLDDLTSRELEVLHWLAEGKTSGETAIIINCSEATVKKHRCNIYRTLGVSKAISAANFYRDAMEAKAGKSSATDSSREESSPP